MAISPESLTVLVLFVLPGFAALYAKQYLSAAPQRRLSLFEESLYSLLYGTIVFVAQCIVTTVLIVAAHRFIGPSGFPLLIEKGLGAFFQAHPMESVALGSIWVISSIAFGFKLGIEDPIERHLLRPILRAGPFRDVSAWYYVLEERRRQLGCNGAYARIELRSGELYFGFVRMWSLHPAEDGSRYLALDEVEYEDSNGNRYRLHKRQPDAMVLLSSKDIESIQVIYENRKRSEERRQ